jgi:quercetin dioxygenase-like cupin family protein
MDNHGESLASLHSSVGVGTKSSAVYFELEPGFQLGTHTDSAEDDEATIDNEKKQLSSGEVGVVPVMEPHNFRNIGSNKAKVVGFFPSANLVFTFEKLFLPAGIKEFDITELLIP